MTELVPRKLEGIQALRGIAALAVIIYHAARHLGQAVAAPAILTVTKPGHAGVDLFFVLSGFIILHVHRHDIGKPHTLGRYAWQRFSRLMPIYWIALAVTIILLLHGHSDQVTPERVALSASLLPSTQSPLLGVAWTLQHEMLFYCSFALLIINRALGLTCLALWLIWGLAHGIGFPIGPESSRFTSVFNLQFLFGMLAALAVGTGRIRAGDKIVLLATCALVFIWMLEAAGWIDGYGNLARFAYGIPSAFLIAGLVTWERETQRLLPRPLVALGEASYSLYLFHLLGIGIAWQVWLRSGINTAAYTLPCLLFLIAGAVASGLTIHYLVEAPLLKRLRSRFSPARQGRGSNQALISAET
jgi:peptidoglycan/LPS O-acetylase OafA/YrhL